MPEVQILLAADRMRVHATSDLHESGERGYSYLTITADIDSPNRTLASSFTQDCEDSEQYILADPQPRSHEVLDGSTRGLPVQDLPPMCLQYDRCRPARLDPAHPRKIDGYPIVHQDWGLQCFSQGDGIRFSSAHRGSSAEGFRSRPISPRKGLHHQPLSPRPTASSQADGGTTTRVYSLRNRSRSPDRAKCRRGVVSETIIRGVPT